MLAVVTAIAVSTFCSAARVGATAKTRRGESIASWACNCATKRRSAASRPSCAMILGQRRGRMRPGRWISSTISWRPGINCACPRSWTSRFSLALKPRFTFRSSDVVAILERVCKEVGYPATIRIDHGSEFVSRGLDLWAYQRGVTLDFSRPEKPTDNAFIEAFNAHFRAECVNAHWFMSLADAHEKVKTWRRYYNEAPAHGAIGNADFAA